MISPTLVFAATTLVTAAAWVWARGVVLLRRRRLAKLGEPLGFTPSAVPPELHRLAQPYLPHIGAADVAVLDLLRRGENVVFRCDYTLGSVHKRRNLTRLLAGRLIGPELTDVTVTAPGLEGYGRLMATFVAPAPTASASSHGSGPSPTKKPPGHD